MPEDFEINFNAVESFQNDLIDFAKKYYEKETKKFLKKEVAKATKKAKQIAKTEVGTSKNERKNWKEATSYHKNFKTGEVYEYQADELACRVYNSSPHGHLIEYGHKQVPRGPKGKSNRGGNSKGFTKGKNVLEKTKIQFSTEFESDCESFLDDLVENGANGNLK